MRPDNYEYLLLIADAQGDLRDKVVFVGGCTAGPSLTDSAAEGIRATKDVDAIVAGCDSQPVLRAGKSAAGVRLCEGCRERCDLQVEARG